MSEPENSTTACMPCESTSDATLAGPDEFVFAALSMPTHAETQTELNADLFADAPRHTEEKAELDGERGIKRKTDDRDLPSDDPSSSDTSGYESDNEECEQTDRVRAAKRARVRRSTAPRSNKSCKRKNIGCDSPSESQPDSLGQESDSDDDEDDIRNERPQKKFAGELRISLPASRGLKRSLDIGNIQFPPNKRRHTAHSDVSEEPSTYKSVLEHLGLDLSSGSSSDSDSGVNEDAETADINCDDLALLVSNDSNALEDTVSESTSSVPAISQSCCSDSIADSLVPEKEENSDTGSSSSLGSDDTDSDDSSSCSSCDEEVHFNIWSATSSSCDSDSWSSGSETEDKNPRYSLLASKPPKCPKSCVCRSGPSLPPTPIDREGRPVDIPLLRRLLNSRLLGPANISPYYCCNRKCCLRWHREFLS